MSKYCSSGGPDVVFQCDVSPLATPEGKVGLTLLLVPMIVTWYLVESHYQLLKGESDERW